jgi:hypothetical protein|tara:strand:- start:1280 stop:1483 length:204 start_codon:yes stop_codon:yes gene_type:complete
MFFTSRPKATSIAEKRYHVKSGSRKTVHPPQSAPIHAKGISPNDNQKGRAFGWFDVFWRDYGCFIFE